MKRLVSKYPDGYEEYEKKDPCELLRKSGEANVGQAEALLFLVS